MTLVITRWLLGFCFSKHDIELLDNPIPDSLYCKPCRLKPKPSRELDLEMAGNGSVDTLGSSAHCSANDVLVTSEPLPGTGNHGNHHAPRKQRTDSFNITHEVDSCDLWKNLVKLDAPLPSPRETPKFHIGGVYHAADAAPDHMGGVASSAPTRHHPLAEGNRTLGPLEECDTDLESQSQLPDYESITTPCYTSLQSPRDASQGVGGDRGFPFPLKATPTSSATPPTSAGRFEHAQWNQQQQQHGTEPVLLSYQSTAV